MKSSLFLNAVMVFIAVSALFGAVRMVRQTLALRGERAAARAGLEALDRQKKELGSRLTELDTPEAVEREAKARLQLRQPGETVVVVVPEEQSAPRAPTPSTLWRRSNQFFAEIFSKGAGFLPDSGPN